MKKYVLMLGVSMLSIHSGIAEAQNADRSMQLLQQTYETEFVVMDVDGDGVVSKQEYMNYQFDNLRSALNDEPKDKKTVKEDKPKKAEKPDLNSLKNVNSTLQAMADFDVDVDLDLDTNDKWLENNEPIAEINDILPKKQDTLSLSDLDEEPLVADDFFEESLENAEPKAEKNLEKPKTEEKTKVVDEKDLQNELDKLDDFLLDIEPEAKGEKKTEAKTEPKAEVEAKPEAKTKPKAEVEAKPEAKTEPKAEVEAKPEAKTEPKAEVEAKPEAKTEPKAEVEAKSEVKTEPKAEVETKPEVKAEAKADTQKYAEIQSTVEILKKSLPKKIDTVTTWTDVAFDTDKINYIYTIDLDKDNYKTSEDKDLLQKVTEEACQLSYKEMCPKLKPIFINEGITVRIQYQDKTAHHIGECELNQTTCK